MLQSVCMSVYPYLPGYHRPGKLANLAGTIFIYHACSTDKSGNPDLDDGASYGYGYTNRNPHALS